MLSPEVAARVEHASEILNAALAAVDPRQAVRAALSFDEASATLTAGDRVHDLAGIDRVLVVGGGKAAAAMALGVCDVLGARVTAGAIVVKDGHRGGLDDRRFSVQEASHPWPDERGAEGTRAIARLLDGTTARDLVVVVVSGGASALLELLPAEVPLADVRLLTEALLRAGAPIGEINVVRKHVSRVKGGQLAAWAAPARVVALVLSDVVGASLDVIASGPTVADPSTFADALDVLRRHGLLEPGGAPSGPPSARAPASVVRHLDRGIAGEVAETPKPGAPHLDAGRVTNVVVADIARAGEAARERASDLGYDASLLTTFLEGEAREVAKVVCSVVREIQAFDRPCKRPAALLLGGETTVTLRGNGKGGRNQELALAAAIALAGTDRVLLASFATDGSDGPTDAAGGLVTGTTVAEGARRGVDASAALANNDAYTFLAETEALLVTGPTGTNVCDLVLALVW
jgi:hydroxypyruvate reductase